MGTRDEASLSPQERAALAGLEARASEDDPALAARLAAGARRFHIHIPIWAPGLVDTLWLGPVLVVVGLAVVVASLSVSLVLGVFGAVLVAAGLASTCRAWAARLGQTASHDEEAPAG